MHAEDEGGVTAVYDRVAHATGGKTNWKPGIVCNPSVDRCKRLGWPGAGLQPGVSEQDHAGEQHRRPSPAGDPLMVTYDPRNDGRMMPAMIAEVMPQTVQPCARNQSRMMLAYRVRLQQIESLRAPGTRRTDSLREISDPRRHFNREEL